MSSIGADRLPTRNFGPCRSAITASGRPTSAWTLRTSSIRAAWSACVPCEKFRRAPSIPAATSARSVSGSLDTGPIVATIFVRRRAAVAMTFRLATASGEGVPPREDRRVTKLFLDAEQLVVLRDAVGTRGRARLDLPRVRRDREVGDGRVLRLAG